MLLAMICWGANWTGAKLIADAAPPQVLIFYRFLFSAVTFLPLLFYKRLSLTLSKSQWFIIGGSSVLMAVYQWFFFRGLHFGLASAGGVMVTTLNPLMTWAIEAVRLRRAVSGKELFGLMLGVLSAVFFLRLWQFDPAYLLNSGTVYFVLAAFCWSVISIIGQYVKISTLVYTFYMFAIVTPFLLIGTTATDVVNVTRAGAVFWFNLAFIATIGTVFATTLFFLANQKLGARTASSFIFLVPASAALIAWLVLGEQLPWTTITGGVLALGGVYSLNYGVLTKKTETKAAA